MAAGNFEKYKSDGSLGGNLLEWVDARFPATSMWKGHLSEYYAPKNFNFWYFFGSLALLVLVIQIVTGIFLVMHYKPDAAVNANGVPVAAILVSSLGAAVAMFINAFWPKESFVWMKAAFYVYNPTGGSLCSMM